MNHAAIFFSYSHISLRRMIPVQIEATLPLRAVDTRSGSWSSPAAPSTGPSRAHPHRGCCRWRLDLPWDHQASDTRIGATYRCAQIVFQRIGLMTWLGLWRCTGSLQLNWCYFYCLQLNRSRHLWFSSARLRPSPRSSSFDGLYGCQNLRSIVNQWGIERFSDRFRLDWCW